jgi:hypothetical protein
LIIIFCKEGIPQQGAGSSRQQAILAISATNKNRAVFPVDIKRPFFKFNSIKEILEA